MVDPIEIDVTINGTRVATAVPPNLLLVEFLRDTLGLTGTHVGCDTTQCGACIVHVGGKSIKSCSYLAVQANGSVVTTIEGLADGETLHPLQAAFQQYHGLQCGFCTPGMIMSGIALLMTNPDPSEPEIRNWLEGNICRCTGYHNIVRAIRRAAVTIRDQTAKGHTA